MSVNLARTISPSKKIPKKRRWVWRTLMSFPVLMLFFLGIMALFVWGVLRYPTVFIPKIEATLAEQGVTAEIASLSFQQQDQCGLTRALCLQAKLTSVSTTKVSLTNVKIDAVMKPIKTWSSLRHPDVTRLTISVEEVRYTPDESEKTKTIDAKKTVQHMLDEALAPLKKTFPEEITVTIERVRVADTVHSMNVFAFMGNVNALLSSQTASLSLKKTVKKSAKTLSKIALVDVVDERLGQIKVLIDLDSGATILDVYQFDLSPWIRQPLSISSFSLTADLNNVSLQHIYTQDFSGLQGKGMIRYNALNVKLNLTGHAQRIDVMAMPQTTQADLLPFSLSVMQLPLVSKGKPPPLKLLIKHFPLSMLQALKSWLPNAESIPSELTGDVSGEVMVDFANNNTLSGTSLYVKNLKGADEIARFDRLSLNIHIDEHNVYIQTDFDKSRFDVPALFPVRGQTFTGKTFARFDTQAKKLIIDDATLSNEDFAEIHLYGGVTFANAERIELNALNIEVADFKAKSLMNYVARKNVSKGFYNWLDQAFLTGKFSGKVYLNGAIKGFFVSDDFILDADFRLDEFKLSYLPNNPPLAMSLGQFQLQNKRLSVNTETGDVLGVPVRGGVVIDDILQPVLKVNLLVPPTNVETLTNTAGQSLAKPAIDKVKTYLNLTGKASMDFLLEYNLINNQFSYDIVLNPERTRVQAKGFRNLPISNATGEIVITEKGFERMHLRGSVAGQPIVADIRSQTNENNQIETSGQVDVVIEPLNFVRNIPGQARLAAALTESSAIRGKTKFQAQFFMQGAELKSLTATSDLVGAEVKLFDILQKESNDVLPLTVDYRGDFGELRVDLHDSMAIKADIDDGQLNSFAITDETHIPLYAETGQIIVNLHPEQVDVNQVLTFVNALGTSSTSQKSQTSLALVTDVSAQTLRYGNLSMENVSVMGDLNAGLHIDSNLLKGSVTRSDNQITGHIEHINVDTFLAQFNRAPTPKKQKQVVAASSEISKALPNVAVTVDKFRYHGVNLGKASVTLVEEKGRNLLKDFHLAGEGFFVNISGAEIERSSGEYISQLTGTLRLNALGKRLKPFLEQGMVNADIVDAEFSLQYAGRFTQIALQKLVGDINFRAVNVSSDTMAMPPSGILKLIDWESLMRRIRLDLDIDLLSLSFDTIDGQIALNHERLTVQTLVAKTALAEINAKGDIDLNKQAFDGFIVTIRPKPAELLPVIGAVASGGTGFAVGLAVDMVAGHPLNHIIQLTYTLSGALSEPNINTSSDEGTKLNEDSDQLRVEPDVTLENSVHEHKGGRENRRDRL